MNGSDKQINWANDIINTTRKRMNQSISEAKARHSHLTKNGANTKEDEILAGRIVACELVLRKLDEIDSAKYAIDNRNNLHIVLLRENMRSMALSEIAAMQGFAKHVSSDKFYRLIFA